MIRLLLLSFALVAVTSAQVAAPHPHPPASSYAHQLDDPRRDAWQKPDQVIETLAIKPGEVIADIGAGTGYFSLRFARRGARVLAVDVDESLLRQLAANAHPHVQTILASPNDPRLPEASVDTVFFCNVTHHIDARESYYRKLRRALKPGARIVVLDFVKEQIPVGPPSSMKLTRAQIVEEFERAGFRLAASHDFLPYQYFLVFEPTAPASPQSAGR